MRKGKTLTEQTKAKYRLFELLHAFPQEEYKDKKRELAERLEVGNSQMDRLIRGDCDPSGTQLWQMAKFFDCTVDALYQSEDAPR